MATTLPLSGDESTTLEEARDNDYNLLVRIRRGAADEILCDQLWDHREEIQALIAHHLRLERTAACLVQPRVTWEIGRFNICVLVETHSLGKTAKMIFRCQKEYQLGEKWFPGVAEEKVRVEAGTYAWIEEHCPEVRIPHLFAFGLKDGPQVRLFDGLMDRCSCNNISCSSGIDPPRLASCKTVTFPVSCRLTCC